VPGSEGGRLDVLFLGDELLPSYRAELVQVLRAHRRVTERSQVIRAGGRLATGAFPGMPTNVDLAVLGVGTDDLGRDDLGAFNDAYKSLVRRLHLKSPDATLVCLGARGPESKDTLAIDEVIATRCRNDSYVRVSRLSRPARISATIAPRLRF
jgi:hypothetical protein